MIEERTMSISKILMYVLGVILLICGVLLVWIIQKGSGDFFDFDRTPTALYVITFVALGGGVWCLYRGCVFAQKEAQLQALPVQRIQARVLSVERRADGRLEVLFEAQDNERLRLYQQGSCRYIEGDQGTLEYKGSYVVNFDYRQGS